MYGLLITFSILVSALFLEKELKKEGKNINIFWGIVFWSTLGGVVGARLYHVLDYYSFYKENIPLIFELWRGGLGIIGGIIAGLFTATLYLKFKKEPVLQWLDRVILVVPFIQSISRWGNFFNQELYGKPTSLPWGIYITSENARFHPLFLYESLLDLALFIILWLLHKRKRTGLITFTFLIGYSAIRIILEEFRLNPWLINGLNVAQLVSILIILISSIGLLYETKFKRQ